MPLYFFHVVNGEESPDRDGVDLASHAEACREAQRAAGRIWSERDNVFAQDSSPWTMHVVDCRGETVCRFDFAASLGPKT